MHQHQWEERIESPTQIVFRCTGCSTYYVAHWYDLGRTYQWRLIHDGEWSPLESDEIIVRLRARVWELHSEL